MHEVRKNRIILNKPLTLYHGSKNSLNGPIEPNSRPDCDFGTGFYTGTNLDQVRGLVASHPSPTIYKLRFDPAQIRDDKKIALTGYSWLISVIAFRIKDRRIQNLPQIKQARQEISHADLVAGAIADDRMNEAIIRFMNNGLSDAALIQCLESVDYGYQYVFKSQKACSMIQIAEAKPLTGSEKQYATSYAVQKRKESMGIVSRMAGYYNREGHFLQEILDNPKLLDFPE